MADGKAPRETAFWRADRALAPGVSHEGDHEGLAPFGRTGLSPPTAVAVPDLMDRASFRRMVLAAIEEGRRSGGRRLHDRLLGESGLLPEVEEIRRNLYTFIEQKIGAERHASKSYMVYIQQKYTSSMPLVWSLLISRSQKEFMQKQRTELYAEAEDAEDGQNQTLGK
ncbi:uncharacterized protein LOC106865463 isoform X1 [Brachypodium distachyon]|uniref:Uncharacterized protein n=1 Tax=Brachypodium distachyon TaxID=15368 RepID=A0A0Q3E2H0_BRADI|nr:uncharacterized protein LOC106865463 isoform X1 [Brachypodium distachyon]KQJ81822.1 hypothetical protein BRADI_5g03275v3 [Brachypodium distachyon]|eukprot:XP_024312170.1 uncharacterized protein LOC106865463 isoform X1 [Brachypodium distachyon]